jgi:hypothetical protein
MADDLHRVYPDLRSKLETLLRYYETTRDGGHTRTLITGTQGTNVLILGATQQDAEALAYESGLPGGRACAWNHHPALFASQFLGERRPLAIDHHALVLLLREVLYAMDGLEAEHERLRTEKGAHHEPEGATPRPRTV